MKKVAAVFAAAFLGTAAVTYGTTQFLSSGPSLSSDVPRCEDWAVDLTTKDCFAAGTLRYVALQNLQGAAQFCVWQGANPGEWSRLKTYAGTGIADNVNVVTWMGNAIKNELEAYFALGAPVFTVQPNTAPNRCRTPLAGPTVQGVTPGQTDATVTVGP